MKIDSIDDGKIDEYEKFIFDLKRNLDVDLRGYKRPQMERRINSLMRTLKIQDYNSFILEMKREKAVLDRFIDHLTINVSQFFRNDTQWVVVEEKILPLLLSKNKNLRIWSAGCSTGEEPYTMSMILRKIAPEGKHHILATDFDNNVLNKARAGIYPAKQIETVPDKIRKAYFNECEGGYVVKEDLKKMIEFRSHNLLRDSFPQELDLIICRNVVIYFKEETKNYLYRKLFSALRPQGILFTGSTEQIINYRDIGFEQAAVFFYKKP